MLYDQIEHSSTKTNKGKGKVRKYNTTSAPITYVLIPSCIICKLCTVYLSIMPCDFAMQERELNAFKL